MENATKLYYELIDLDFMDYADTLQNDLDFIKTFIDLYGYNDAKQILKAYFE